MSFVTAPPPRVVGGDDGLVGIDRGVVVSVMTSDGEAFNSPTLTNGEDVHFGVLEHRLSTQTRGSRRYAETLRKMNVLRLRLTNRRRDWVEQTTTDLARRYSSAGIEKLNIGGMTKRPKPKPDPDRPGEFLPNGATAKSSLARGILGAQWGLFATRLSDKMDVYEVPSKNTSRRCNKCKHTCEENRESQAVFSCTKCGHVAHADVNAAENIRDDAVCGGTRREWAKRKRDANLQLIA